MPDNLLENLNREQLAAVTHDSGPLMIIAGAGTGKTTVITHRIGWLIEQGKAKAEEILALTFTEKAAAEMEERVDRLLPFGYLDLWISTFHGFCERLLKQHALDIGIPNDFKLLNQTDAWLLVRQNFARFELNYYRPAGNPTKFIQALLEHFSRAKDEGVSPDEYLAHVEEIAANQDMTNIGGMDETEIARLRELANAYHTYQRLLLEQGTLDFGDLIFYTLKLLKERPAILAQYQKQFRYVLVDEFQDTNWAQYELVKMLAAPENNLTVVGDDDQCLPGAALISTPNGEVFIKKIRLNDEVLCGFGKGHLGVSKVNHIFEQKKSGNVIEIFTASGKHLLATDNHKFFCHVPQKADHKHYYVYLMLRRDLGWRIGTTNDLVTRIRLERSADHVIALRSFKTDVEARYYETLWSLKYGIPTVCFKERKGLIVKGDLLRKLYKELDVAGGVKELAKDLNIDLDGHHFTLGAVIRGGSRRIKVRLEMVARRTRSKYFVASDSPWLRKADVRHIVSLETSDKAVARALQKENFSLRRTKGGWKFQFVSVDLMEAGRVARKLVHISGGTLEVFSRIGLYQTKSLTAVVIPAKNLMEGLFVPVMRDGEIWYDKIVHVERFAQTGMVYDLEVDRAHNYIANGIVVHNSIYKFRGASLSNILQFQKDFLQTKTVVLTQNYRSFQSILDAAYGFIQQNNPNRLEVQEMQKQQGLSKRLITNKEGSGIIEHIHCSSLEEESMRVAERILDLQKAGTPLQEIAILVRANDTAEPFVRQLDRVGVPYIFFALKGLYVKPIILDALAYLRAIDEPNASPSLYRLLSHPMLAIDPRDIVMLTHECYRRGKALIQVIESARSVRDLHIGTFQCIGELLHQLNVWRESARRKPVSELYVEVMKASGLLGYVNGMSERKQMEEFRYLQQFYERLKRFELASTDRSLHTFLQEFEHEQGSGDEGALKADPEQGPECVRVMTIHSAKGLEFSHVFIVSMVDRRFPTSERKEAIPLPEKLIKEILPEGDIHLEEERRLMYVALTRAKQGVYLTSAEDYGGARKKKPSRFLHELGLMGSGLESGISKSDSHAQKFLIPDLTPFDATTPHITPPKAFSFTQLAAFETCPLQYKFAHVLHVPVYGRYVMSFGKTMHNTLQKFFELFKARIEHKQSSMFEMGSGLESGILRSDAHAQKFLIPDLTPSLPVELKELMQLYNEAWIDEWYENDLQREEYRTKGRKALTDYFAQLLTELPKPLHLEKGFSLKLGDVTVKGRIDRIDVIEGGVEIIDYKTGAPKIEEKMSAEDKRQLMIYQLAAERCFDPPLKPAKLTYHYLEDNSRVSFLGKPEELEALIAQIQDTTARIRSSNFTPTPGFMCRYCDFRDICEFRQ